MDDGRLFHAIPEWLDFITSSRDWEREIKVIEACLPVDRPVWEMGCKTGRVGALLGTNVSWSGGESNAKYFELAQLKHGDNVFSTDLPSHKVPFVFSWFSPLYAIHFDALKGVLSDLLSALQPDGLCVLEGGVNPEHVRSRFSMMDTYETADLKLVRSCVPVLSGSVITFDYFWMATIRGLGEIRHVDEQQVYFVHKDAQVMQLVQSLGGHVVLRNIQGVRVWFLALQPDPIDRLIGSF